jgi:outer membrane protein, heavy metal efflux system
MPLAAMIHRLLPRNVARFMRRPVHSFNVLSAPAGGGVGPAGVRLAGLGLAGLGLVGLGLAGIVGCASVPPASPEATVPPREVVTLPQGPLTAEQAVALALTHDAELRAARHRIAAARWQTVQASLPDNLYLGGTVDPGEWVLRLGARIIDLLDLGGGRRAAVRAAYSREEQAVLAVLQRQRDLVRRVRLDYAEAALGVEISRLWRDQIGLIEDLLAIARQQQALGELTTVAVLQLERRLLETRMAATDHELAWRQARARLNRRLGLAPLDAVELVPPATPQGWTPGYDAALVTTRLDSATVDLGLLRRPELLLVLARAREQQAQLGIARVAWLEGEAGPYLKRGDGPLFGGFHAVLAVPIFDRGQARRATAGSLLAALEEEFLAVQADLVLEVHAAWWVWQHRTRRLAEELAALRAQTVATHALLAEAHALGAASRLQVHEARLAILDADLLLAGARLDALRAQAELAAALGDRGEAVGPTVAEQGRTDHGQD